MSQRRRDLLALVADLHHQLGEAHAALAALDEHDASDVPLVDVLSMLPGLRLSERRTMLRACKAGELQDAIFLNRRWRAPRASIVAWLQRRGPRVVASPETEGDDLADTRARLLGPSKRSAPRRARRSS